MYDILNNLIDWTTSRTNKLTDFNVGSGIRTVYEAVSVQLEEFYVRMKQNVLYAITNSIYQAFGFDRLAENYATGEVTITFIQAVPVEFTIPKGTVFSTSAVYGYIYFETLEDYYVKVGLTSVIVPVQCKTAGSVGNVPRGAITTMIPTNSLVKSVYNILPFTDGQDAETATEHKKRFQRYINTLARATRNAILYGTLEVDGVTGAWVDDNYIGYVKLYAHNSEGELPSTLRTEILNNLVNYRAAGIEVEVLPIVKINLDVNLRIMLADEYDTDIYEDAISNIITNYLNDYTVGTHFYLADIITFIKSSYQDAVINVLPVGLTDIELQSNQLIRPGTITITCVNKSAWRY